MAQTTLIMHLTLNHCMEAQQLTSPNITVTLNQGVVEVVNNNIASGYVGISDNITFTFSHAMDSSSVEITLTTSGNNVSFDVIWIDAYNLVINPHDNLTAGSSYNISITGLSADNSTLSTSNSLNGRKRVWNCYGQILKLVMVLIIATFL